MWIVPVYALMSVSKRMFPLPVTTMSSTTVPVTSASVAPAFASACEIVRSPDEDDVSVTEVAHAGQAAAHASAATSTILTAFYMAMPFIFQHYITFPAVPSTH